MRNEFLANTSIPPAASATGKKRREGAERKGKSQGGERKGRGRREKEREVKKEARGEKEDREG